jgi:2,3-dihydroxyphenylpropionate 1,2-dioxygenase
LDRAKGTSFVFACEADRSRGRDRGVGLLSRGLGDTFGRTGRTTMMSTVIGGAMLPHAPQFFTMPDTEDKANVERVRTVAGEIGSRLRALEPDLWIIFSNDHAEQFFHQAAPPFTIHVGGEATGEFAGRKFRWQIPSEISFELVRALYRQNFDPAFTSTARIDYAIGIPLTHIGHTGPVLPIYVNAYLPPQPTMERCYSFGQAIARTVTAMGLKTVILSSGGMSHFPGTDRYANPELAWDKSVLEKLAAGKLKSLIGYDETELDETGNIELRCWACAAGALGERRPDIVSMDPSWHHNYASLAWIDPAPGAQAPHYPSIKPELVALTSALHGLAHDAEQRAQYVADAGAYADRFALPADQREALIRLDLPAIVKMGTHPLVPFLAQMQIQRLRAR